METELKLTLAAKDIPALKAHPVLAAAGDPHEIEQLDVYYDTPEHELWQRGYALRVRCARGKYVQTFKGGGASVGGMHVRDEWESALADGKPDPAALARQAEGHQTASALLAPGVAGKLLPVFTNTTTRTLWNLQPAPGCEVECVLDVATIRCGKRHTAMVEVELELKRGEPGQLIVLAQELNNAVALRIENASKAERGYVLAGVRQPPAPVKARPIALRAKATLDDALQRILQNCLEHMEANVAGVLAQDIEYLHQMRVGLRRLRAALHLFKSKVQLPADLQQDVDWLAALLGKARNWDVFITDTLDKVGGASWNASRSALRVAAAQHAAAAHKAVQRALHSRRYTGLILGLAGWISGRQWRQPADGVLPGKLDSRVHKGMRPLLAKTQRRLHKRIRRVDSTDAASLHRVRIAAKQSRYAAEFFQPFLKQRPLKKQLNRLATLQEMLGNLNDAAIADTLLAQLGRDHGAPAEAIAFARGYLAATAEQKMRSIGKPLRQIK
ncbi:inorganic triphosphatase [Pseudoduganella ginsengisoli]|uniref:CHAD domain-containing protein n=1 Tax=Pseudoduganella ginsengisoli TaxID=1462440 RepID=A0A6L6Q7M2_9BURK|nr:CYTH and CHAD domain-containing protein [Pseudoduganella ginsengisoli]MTW05172.1 CHAD domain-containing protein [Pseudoduganella ginsengisoli]